MSKKFIPRSQANLTHLIVFSLASFVEALIQFPRDITDTLMPVGPKNLYYINRIFNIRNYIFNIENNYLDK